MGATCGRAWISCNVSVGAYQDHIFAPVELAQQALAALVEFSSKLRARGSARDVVRKQVYWVCRLFS